MLMTSSVSHYVRTATYYPVTTYKLANVNKKNTYALVFGLGNLNQLAWLEKQKEINILYKSPKAVNKAYGHGTNPRNTLVIFELKD